MAPPLSPPLPSSAVVSRERGLFAAAMAEPELGPAPGPAAGPGPVSAEAVLRELALFELHCQGEDVPARRERTGGARPRGRLGGRGGC